MLGEDGNHYLAGTCFDIYFFCKYFGCRFFLWLIVVLLGLVTGHPAGGFVLNSDHL